MQRDREITIEEKTKKKGVKRVGGETPVSASAEPELGFQKFLVREAFFLPRETLFIAPVFELQKIHNRCGRKYRKHLKHAIKLYASWASEIGPIKFHVQT